MNTLKGLRLITNLHCNYKCNFCYQVDKSKKILSLDEIKKSIDNHKQENFDYCTIMGGESTLLKNLPDYIKLASNHTNQVRLTTNGSLLTKEKMEIYKDNGLTGINFSIASIENYSAITGTAINWRSIISNITMANKIFSNAIRINIPLCEENMDGELKQLISYFLNYVCGNITICESITSKYSCLDNPEEKMGATLIEDTDTGLIFFDYEGKKFGYYSHKDNYNNTDLVITPLGTYISWDGYCEAVGINYQTV